jgi:hypothetical protein
MAMTQLLLQHSQQIGNDIQPFREQSHPLIHLEVAPDGLVDGLELGLDPEELWGVEDGAVEVDADAEDEQLADLHVDLGAREGDLAGHRELSGYVFAGVDGGGD